jgi:predicted RNA-binding Zn-ribbon protein involved in translation (DUF1610 family)
VSKRRGHTLTMVLLGVFFIAGLPLIIPAAAILHWLHRRRLHAAARLFACPACGAILGDEAIRRADEAWSRHWADLGEKNPGIRFRTGPQRIIRQIDAICPQCGAGYKFAGRGKIFAAPGGD